MFSSHLFWYQNCTIIWLVTFDYLLSASEQIRNAFLGHDSPSWSHWCKSSVTTCTKTVKQQNSKLISPETNRHGHERNSEERHSCGAAFPTDRDAKCFSALIGSSRPVSLPWAHRTTERNDCLSWHTWLGLRWGIWRDILLDKSPLQLQPHPSGRGQCS